MAEKRHSVTVVSSHLKCDVKKPVLGDSDQVDTIWAVKSQKMARGLKFWI